MLLVQYVKEGRIPDNILPLLPSYNCPMCGHFLHVNLNLTQLYCDNRVCPSHMSMRMVEMLKDLRVRDLGDVRCLDIMRRCKMKHHTDILFVDEDTLPSNYSYSMRLKWVEDFNKDRDATVAEMVSYMQINNLGLRRCNRIFEGVGDINDIYNQHTTEQQLVRFVAERLSDSEYTYNVGVLPKEIGKSLWEEKDYLIRFQTKFHIRGITQFNLTLAFTGSIENVTDDEGYIFKPRDTFLKWLNRRYKGVITVKVGGTTNCDFIIADRPSSSEKYIEGERRGNLLTSDQLVRVLDKFIQDNKSKGV